MCFFPRYKWYLGYKSLKTYGLAYDLTLKSNTKYLASLRGDVPALQPKDRTSVRSRCVEHFSLSLESQQRVADEKIAQGAAENYQDEG